MHKIWLNIVALYVPTKSSSLFAYMLQSVEYRVRPYLAWLWQTRNFVTVMRRRSLEPTKAAQLLRLGALMGMAMQIVFGLGLVLSGVLGLFAGGVWAGIFVLLVYPLLWAHILAVVVAFGNLLFAKPREARLAAAAMETFINHPGKRIAVVGSYGKTSMKELLVTVLGEACNVAATPANQNVISSHARFARTLKGNEDYLIVEFGEGRPGDVGRFSEIVRPTHAVITGIAPAHLDEYKTVAAAGGDIFTVARYVSPGNVYVNDDSPDAANFMVETYKKYGKGGSLGWHVSDAVTGFEGTDFKLMRKGRKLKLHSQLIGLHHIGPLAFVAAFALQQGIAEEKVVSGVAKTKPFEHRMQPYRLAGAWVIDDTYNGNIEGIRAGTELLSKLPAKRKVYVTPGLVDQGEETARIHREIGGLIAGAKPDMVVLMENSVTKYIREGLDEAGYVGNINVQPDPLDFYTHLEDYLAAGDVVLMQNDWTDNYR